MSINKQGKFWIGSEASDIDEYLRAYASDGYGVHEIRRCRCACGNDVFQVEASAADAVARRTCNRCGHVHFMFDSAKSWDDTEDEPQLLRCTECGATDANIGVGFSLYQEEQTKGEIRWLYIGHRCAQCDVLGSFADWKVAGVGAHHLLNSV
jgi:hypothetical protein